MPDRLCKKERTGCPGTFSQSGLFSDEKRRELRNSLCVSFECDPLSEELGKRKKRIQRWKFLWHLVELEVM